MRLFKGWFPYDRRRSRIADRGSRIAKRSAIVCDHMETHFCHIVCCDFLASTDFKVSILVTTPAQRASNFDISADRNVCNSRLCDRLRLSAIIWKQVSLRSSAIIWKPALTDMCHPQEDRTRPSWEQNNSCFRKS